VSQKKFKISDWLQYIFVESLFFLVRIIPFSWNRWIWKNISLLAFKIMKSRRLLTIENIRNARERGFLEKDIDDYQLARQTWEHLGIIGSEFLYFYTRTPEQLKKLVKIEGEENLKKVLAKQKGIVLVMGHIGNWELLGMFLSVFGYKLSPVVKTQSNSFLDKIIEEKRHSVGMKTIPNKGFLRPIVDAFKRNEIVPFLIDQEVRKFRVKVNFFGREASIPQGAAEFSLRTGTPVIFAYINRVNNNQHILVISEEISLKQSGNNKQDIIDNTTLFMNLIQDVVKKHPDQWLWMHSLWSTKLKI
jgi:Kdo2-lipid IVA lauroyltransferase/acyltransferase